MFLPCNFMGWGTTDRLVSGVHGPIFSKLDEDMGQSLLHRKFVSAFGYLAAFSNAGGSLKLSDVENDAKFCIFWPPWKLREGWVRCLYQLLNLYLRLNLQNTFDGYPLHGCWFLIQFSLTRSKSLQFVNQVQFFFWPDHSISKNRLHTSK